MMGNGDGGRLADRRHNISSASSNNNSNESNNKNSSNTSVQGCQTCKMPRGIELVMRVVYLFVMVRKKKLFVTIKIF